MRSSVSERYNGWAQECRTPRLRVQGVRDSCVTVFAFGAYIYVETTGMFLPEDISYGPRAMPHNSFFDVYPLLYVRCFLFYILLRGYIYLPRPITMSARS